MEAHVAKVIWLEVSEVQFESESSVGGQLLVLLKADREQPKPGWWPVEPKAIGGENPFDGYKQILGEMDKKRTVLARLGWDATANRLWCNAFRFQSSDASSR